MGLEEIRDVVRDYTSRLEESLEVLTTLQEESNIWFLEIEVQELQ